MADKEMQLQDVPCEADGILKGEPSEPGKDQNPSELIPDNEDGDGQADDDVLKGEPSEPEKDQNLPLQDNQDVDAQANGREKTQVRFLSPDPRDDENPKKRKTWLLSDSEAQGDDDDYDDDEAGTPEEQQAFLRELDTFHRENFLDYKPLKFYQKPLNTLKLWRAVIKLGGHEVVTTSKLWRQVGESFNPPKTCTTISYTFRNFYEKALLEYEKHLRKNGDLNLPGPTLNMSSSLDKEVMSHQGSGSGRARRDSAARAMQGWQAHRLEDSGEDMGLNSTPKHKKLKSIGLPKPRTPNCTDLVASQEAEKQSVGDVIDDGPLADWVKITVKETKESFEVFALVPGLLRNEIRIQSDPAGRLIITGEPEQLDNPWGITPFKKIVVLPARIDPLHTNAIMSMHGRLFIRAQYEK
ncbi:PREDICTED: AT-rich interactive domain-containing protein 6 [Brassica oleracea var. oleracea]|uniref:ARID domain-containing protein n=1 Tax=Brassica oleracea var. oleracea TaxID=109376 RepID=A0A0D3CBX4_BRAOL|nr:PREDICTED: AT-rich interactive domain-containing protein 6 [Brassica oleracea var. oleracea]